MIRLKIPKLLTLAVFLRITLLSALAFEPAAAASASARARHRMFMAASSINFAPVNLSDEQGRLTGLGKELSNATTGSAGGELACRGASSWPGVLEWDFFHGMASTLENRQVPRDGFAKRHNDLERVKPRPYRKHLETQISKGLRGGLQ